MQFSFQLADWLFWALFLIIGFPLSNFLLEEIITRLERYQKPLYIPTKIIHNLVLPILVLFILLLKVLGIPRDDTAVKIVETFLWTTVIYTGLSFFKAVLFEDTDQNTWRSKIPKLLVDLIRFLLVLLGIALVLSSVWNANIAGLVTALGIGSLVIGLALQDNLSNIFSGIALLFERPFKIGDWVELSQGKGKVEEITWRAIHIKTTSGTSIVVPNSQLAKTSFINLSNSRSIYQATANAQFSLNDPPTLVKEVLKQTVLEIDGVLADPSPGVSIVEYGNFEIKYLISFSSKDYEKSLQIRGEFLTRLWYVAKRNNFTISMPALSFYGSDSLMLQTPLDINSLYHCVLSIPSLSDLDLEFLASLNLDKSVVVYTKDEKIINQNQVLSAFYLIVQGKVELSLINLQGETCKIADLEKGEFFGEKLSLITEQINEVSAIAVNEVKVLSFNKNILEKLLNLRPIFASELGEVMEIRRKAIVEAIDEQG